VTARLAALLLMVLLGCGGPRGTWQPERPGLRTWVEGKKDGGGVLVVQLTADAKAKVDLPEPSVQGLTFEPQGNERVEKVGQRVVLTQRYSFTGEKGMYEVPALVAHAGQAEMRSDPLWIDLGVQPPRKQKLADIDEPGRVWQPPTLFEWSLVGLVGVCLVAGVVFLRAARRPSETPVERPPAHIRALRAWEAVRDDPSLSDHDKALAISRIFREYMEEVLRFQATAWTTTEILEQLRTMAFLPEGNVPRARRLLRATDRIKFADAQARAEMFEELDADLRGFLDSTRPRSWQAEEGAA
jgi:hypothetical protein